MGVGWDGVGLGGSIDLGWGRRVEIMDVEAPAIFETGLKLWAMRRKVCACVLVCVFVCVLCVGLIDCDQTIQ